MSTMRQFRVSSLCITGWLLAVYTILSHIIWMLHVPIPMNPMELEMTSIRRITTNSQMEENTNINIDENTNDGNNNDDNNLLDQVSRDELPIIYPNTFIVREGPSFGELVHATWPKRDNKATRQYGVGPLAQDPPQGETVDGNWPDALDALTYVPLLKNGHTSLANAVGDLRQRLNGSALLIKLPKTNITQSPYVHLLNWIAKDSTIVPHKLFTVLRDPIDRYISATCEELRQGVAYRKMCLSPNRNTTMQCTIQHLPRNYTQVSLKFKPHQELQIKQLHTAMQGHHIGLAVIPFTSLSKLMSELGCATHSTKVRDRKSEHYTTATAKSGTILEGLRGHDINLLKKQTPGTTVLNTNMLPPKIIKSNHPPNNHRRLSTKLTLEKIMAQNQANKQKSLHVFQLEQNKPKVEKTASTAQLNHKKGLDVLIQWQANGNRNKQTNIQAILDDVKSKLSMIDPKAPLLLGQNKQKTSLLAVVKKETIKTSPEDKALMNQAISNFCSMHANDLTEEQIYSLCSIYHKDVELLESVGISVPHCAKYLKKVGLQGFEVVLG